jgi:anti-sigma regulatory factor (Ser/Thr protein kinase)
MTAGTAAHLSSTLELAPLPPAVACARLHAVHVLHEWGLRKLADDAAMIVSEMVTNAVDASVALRDHPPVTLRLSVHEGAVLIEVWDQSPEDPKPRQAGADDECGRGLAVVEALSTRWGFERSGYRRKVVWAELALPVQAGRQRA